MTLAKAWTFTLTRHILVALTFGLGSPAFAADLKVIAPNAVKESVTEVGQRFERESGHRIDFTWAGSETISKRMTEGDVFDVVLNAASNIDRGVADGKLVPGSRVDFAKSGIGVAVRSGLPHPDVSTVEGLRQALIRADSIAISSGTSGRYLQSLFQQLGVAEQIKSKTIQPPPGAQIGELIARGDAALGFQQVAELLHAKGVDFLGALPADVQSYTVWSAALRASSTQAEIAQSFIAELKSAASATVIKTTGMEPM